MVRDVILRMVVFIFIGSKDNVVLRERNLKLRAAYQKVLWIRALVNELLHMRHEVTRKKQVWYI